MPNDPQEPNGFHSLADVARGSDGTNLYGRRQSDEPITEQEMAAIGRAAHAELLAILERKRHAREARRRRG